MLRDNPRHFTEIMKEAERALGFYVSKTCVRAACKLHGIVPRSELPRPPKAETLKDQVASLQERVREMEAWLDLHTDFVPPQEAGGSNGSNGSGPHRG